MKSLAITILSYLCIASAPVVAQAPAADEAETLAPSDELAAADAATEPPLAAADALTEPGCGDACEHIRRDRDGWRRARNRRQIAAAVFGTIALAGGIGFAVHEATCQPSGGFIDFSCLDNTLITSGIGILGGFGSLVSLIAIVAAQLRVRSRSRRLSAISVVARARTPDAGVSLLRVAF